VNLLDILLVMILAGSVVAGFIAGFARVGIGFIAAIMGLVCGFWFYGIPAGYVHKYVTSELVSNIIGFLIIFMAYLIVGAFIAKLLSKLFKWTGLSFIDRFLGGVFGLVRGAVMATAFVAILMAFTPKPTPNWMVDSQLLPYAVDASDVCASLAPKAVKDGFAEGLRDIRKAWDDQFKKKKHKPKEAEV
jgi:membrane protein required for colicin V production